jgi:nucleotidyltransferase substrate binding protein (TIGR01987 family)
VKTAQGGLWRLDLRGGKGYGCFMDEDVRWKQRFDNYKKALSHLKSAVHYAKDKPKNDIGLLSVIKAFELSFEPAWNVMKDFLTMKGIAGIIGSKDAVRHAHNEGLISDGQLWINMIDVRNLATHSYNEETAEAIVEKIIEQYFAALTAFTDRMESFL